MKKTLRKFTVLLATTTVFWVQNSMAVDIVNENFDSVAEDFILDTGVDLNGVIYNGFQGGTIYGGTEPVVTKFLAGDQITSDVTATDDGALTTLGANGLPSGEFTWIEIDFGAQKDISGFSFDYTKSGGANTQMMAFCSSDGNSWTTFVDKTQIDPNADVKKNFSFPAATGSNIQYVRLYISKENQYFPGAIYIDNIIIGKMSSTTVDDHYQTNVDTELVVDAANGVLANDDIYDSETLTVATDAASSEGGVYSIAADGSFTYTPAADFHGVDSFIYTLGDTVGTVVIAVDIEDFYDLMIDSETLPELAPKVLNDGTWAEPATKNLSGLTWTMVQVGCNDVGIINGTKELVLVPIRGESGDETTIPTEFAYASVDLGTSTENKQDLSFDYKTNSINGSWWLEVQVSNATAPSHETDWTSVEANSIPVAVNAGESGTKSYTIVAPFRHIRMRLWANGGGGWDQNLDVISIDNFLLVDSSSTPAHGVEVVQVGTELTWSVEDERDVKEYQVVDAATGEVLEVVMAGKESYSTTIPEGVEAQLVVVDNSGYTQNFIPADGNIITTPYTLTEGWNLITITGENADLSALEVATTGQFWAWNGTAYEAESAPQPTQGVWVYSPKTVQVEVTAEKSDASIELVPGWNLVGPVENCDTPEAANAIYSWNKTYEQIVAESDTLLRGVGYWIFSL